MIVHGHGSRVESITANDCHERRHSLCYRINGIFIKIRVGLYTPSRSWQSSFVSARSPRSMNAECVGNKASLAAAEYHYSALLKWRIARRRI
jgi:hypothetical protein